MVRLIACLLMIGVTGCATGPSANSCGGFKPIYPTRADVAVISDKLGGQIVKHNTHGEAICGWERAAR